MKNKIIGIIFLIIIFGFMLASIIIKDEKYSFYERRLLSTKPNLLINNEINKDYFKDFDSYVIDQFPLRDSLRTIKSYFLFDVLLRKDYNDVFYKDGYIFKMQDTNMKSINYFINKMNELYNVYLQNSNVYYSIIPDKMYYLDDTSYLKLDYDYIFNNIINKLNKNMKYIDITKDLQLNSYYSTDIHIKQDKLLPVVKTLSNFLNIKTDTSYEIKKFNNFYGALYGNIALNLKTDVINYLTNNIIEAATVYNVEKDIIDVVYNEEYLNHLDSYDIFLGGATPLLYIENNKCNNNQELIIIRDSFGSSLAPLLIESYKKITLIDIRYINSKLLKDYVDFKGKDVLIMYGMEVINNSFSLN